MGGSFQTNAGEKSADLQPLQVAVQKNNLIQAAVELAEDLDWNVDARDDEAGVVTCSVQGGFLKGNSVVTITFEGPEGIPSTTVNLRSETEGGLLAADKANIQRFRKLFDRRTSASK